MLANPSYFHKDVCTVEISEKKLEMVIQLSAYESFFAHSQWTVHIWEPSIIIIFFTNKSVNN